MAKSHPASLSSLYRGVNHGPRKMSLVPLWPGKDFLFLLTSKNACEQLHSTGAAIQGTASTATKHEVHLPYQLSVTLYPCNNHDCGAVNGPEKGLRLCSPGAKVT